MAVFHSTGKDENFQMLTGDHLAMGGQPGSLLLLILLLPLTTHNNSSTHQPWSLVSMYTCIVYT